MTERGRDEIMNMPFDVIISPMDAIKYATALRTEMARIGVENYTRPHPLRDLLDILEKPGLEVVEMLRREQGTAGRESS